MSKRYFGCCWCGKPVDKFRGHKGYAIGCFWQDVFCSKKCVWAFLTGVIETLDVEMILKASDKIGSGFNE